MRSDKTGTIPPWQRADSIGAGRSSERSYCCLNHLFQLFNENGRGIHRTGCKTHAQRMIIGFDLEDHEWPRIRMLHPRFDVLPLL